MKKKLFMLLCFFLIILSVAIVLFARNNKYNASIGIKENLESARQCIWGARRDIDPSIGDGSLLFFDDRNDGTRIMYYDVKTEKSRVFCTRPNCKHNDEKCPAFFQGAESGEDIFDAAQIGRYVYCVYYSNPGGTLDHSKDEIQLLRIDPYENTRTVVASFKNVLAAEPDDSAQYVKQIDSVTYSEGYMWCKLRMKRSDGLTQQHMSHSVPCCIDLSDGKVTIFKAEEGFERTFIASYDPHYVITSSEHYEGVKVTPDDYDKLDSLIVENSALYFDYDNYLNVYAEKHGGTCRLSVTDITSGDKKVLCEDEMVLLTYYDGKKLGYAPKRQIQGMYCGVAVIREYIPDSSGEYCLDHFQIQTIDLNNGTIDTVYETTSGILLTIAQSHSVNGVLADGMLYFGDNVDDESFDMMCLDMNTGKVQYLYKDRRAVSFLLYGLWGDGYCGKLAIDQDNFYWISIEDFRKGEFKNAVRYRW